MLVLVGLVLSVSFDTAETLTGKASSFGEHLKFAWFQAVLMAFLVVPGNLFAFRDGKQSAFDDVGLK
ncbi:hypothetical protein [Sulfitobacter mediterraneus]|uniref:hypothetical protein n=1 Tax=Sulfitobacter mediterraneus TaxID=83219 RepID=UPI0012DFDD8B|nr:hypothetical protein [Sulfitobacter mediterraneus]